MSTTCVRLVNGGHHPFFFVRVLDGVSFFFFRSRLVGRVLPQRSRRNERRQSAKLLRKKDTVAVATRSDS